jgi:hypothetical protein
LYTYTHTYSHSTYTHTYIQPQTTYIHTHSAYLYEYRKVRVRGVRVKLMEGDERCLLRRAGCGEKEERNNGEEKGRVRGLGLRWD